MAPIAKRSFDNDAIANENVMTYMTSGCRAYKHIINFRRLGVLELKFSNSLSIYT